MKIYELKAVNPSIVSQIRALIYQLSPQCKLPSEQDLQVIIDAGSTRLFVAEADNLILGTLTLVFNKIPTGNKVWIEDVVVDKDARGKKIGVQLTQFAIDYVKQHGSFTINLTSSPQRVAANNLYQKLGFTQRETNVYRMTFK